MPLRDTIKGLLLVLGLFLIPTLGLYLGPARLLFQTPSHIKSLEKKEIMIFIFNFNFNFYKNIFYISKILNITIVLSNKLRFWKKGISFTIQFIIEN